MSSLGSECNVLSKSYERLNSIKQKDLGKRRCLVNLRLWYHTRETKREKETERNRDIYIYVHWLIRSLSTSVMLEFFYQKYFSR